ncbi:MAG: helix-turn-helix domain-containing protein [Oscillospiraceae bacterium]|nr:helix-turn-helix domain-containing protein [Oscillospiraceae bacterium]
MRMRTIEQAAEYLKAQDPGTALTKTALRRLVTTGGLPSVRVGTKYLIALENLDAFLAGETVEAPQPSVGLIRPVEVSR